MTGFFNILVYTRPHVVTVRRRHGDYLWLRAFLCVVKSCGDHDGRVRCRRRRISWITRQRPGREQENLAGTSSQIRRSNPRAGGAIVNSPGNIMGLAVETQAQTTVELVSRNNMYYFS